MSILDVDVGNSRVKWRVLGDDGVPAEAGALWRGEAPDVGGLPIDVARVRVSSVASAGWNRAFATDVRVRCGVTPEFAHPRAAHAGVTCGYREPGTLGVDRWLAVLAAWRRAAGAAAVLDCGTAATLDFVTATGAHIGGYIVPGLRLMTSALFKDTADVKVEHVAAQADLGPGESTAAAVQRGVVRMLSDFLDGSVARFREQCDDPPHVFVCGGDADIIAPHLTTSAAVVPGLVLDGLAIALP